MKRITPLIDSYTVRKNQLVSKNLSQQELLKEKIKAAKDMLHELRLHIRKNDFATPQEEIYFFKHVKAKICGEIKFHTCQLSFYVEKPNATVCIQKDYIKAALKKLEAKKRKNIAFYKYYKSAETTFDDKFFLRGAGQFDLFSEDNILCLDPEFNTSHDMLASEVIVYDLLTEFYKIELRNLKKMDAHCPEQEVSRKTKRQNIKWTGSKSELIELVYALHGMSVLDNGNIDIKEIVSLFEQMFNTSLGDFYRAYHDIRSRKINQTKFLDKLKESFVKRLHFLDE